MEGSTEETGDDRKKQQKIDEFEKAIKTLSHQDFQK
jgi:hypothetical protein